MPGIAGCVWLTGDALPEGFPALLEAPLSREPDYDTLSIVDAPDASAIVFAPRLSFPVAGAGSDPESGISVGYYGEFFGDGAGQMDAAAIANRLIELYREHREALPLALDGTFVVFVWDARAREGLLCNDHYASRPVCYAEQNGRFYFSPEPKGVARLPEVRCTTDLSALMMQLTYGHLLGGATYYQQVKYLAPGSVVRIRPRGIAVRRYFEYLVNESPAGADSPELEGALADVLREACRRRLRHLPNMILPISGGYDSRGLLAVIQSLTGRVPKTISWGTDEDTPDADAHIGGKVARFFGTEHRFLRRDSSHFIEDVEETIARVDGGSMDAVQHPSELRLMRQIRREIGTDYLIRGDEVFGFKGAAASNAEAMARCGLRNLGEYPDILRLLNPSCRPDFLERSRAALEAVNAECPLAGPTPRKDYIHYNQKIRNFANRSNYYKLSVLEAANPWLDKTVVEFLKTIPAPCRVEKALYRRTLSAMFPDLMQIPIATNHSLENWAAVMREHEPLQKFIRFHLLEQRNRLHEIVDLAQVRQIVFAVFQGRRAESAKVGLAMRAKRTLRGLSPKFYDVIRSKAQGRFVISAAPADTLILRLLLLKLWCDQLP